MKHARGEKLLDQPKTEVELFREVLKFIARPTAHTNTQREVMRMATCRYIAQRALDGKEMTFPLESDDTRQRRV